jgi:hypothetical protein
VLVLALAPVLVLVPAMAQVLALEPVMKGSRVDMRTLS